MSKRAVSELTEENETTRLGLKDFFESVPPNRSVEVVDQLKLATRGPNSHTYNYSLPRIKIHCSHDECSGERYFDPLSRVFDLYKPSDSAFVEYCCSNCGSTRKRYAVSIKVLKRDAETESALLLCEKYGELPSFGVPTPTKLLNILGQDRELFLKGRRCESQGLGIAAFAYYRRAVENRKSDLISEIIKVAELVGADQQTISALTVAQKETQFSKALSDVKDAIPESLKIKGQNPLTLLHSALSDGLHGRSDEECLNTAHDVRIVLAELSERIMAALKDTAELNSAVSRLSQAKMRPKESKNSKATAPQSK